MATPLTAQKHDFNDYLELLEYFYEQRWTDGHPIVPPTEPLVRRFLDYVQLEPDAHIADFTDRNRRVTAEGVAINAVMAGCKPEYMPVLIAGVKAMAHPSFEFNHIACIASALPHFIICGPIVKELGINHGVWAWGAGDRATSTIGRAFSLILWNLLEQKPGAVQRGQIGQPGRWTLCIAENPDTPWTPLNVTEGFSKETNTVTCLSLYPNFGQEHDIAVMEPEVILGGMAAQIASPTMWRRGVMLVQVPPVLTNFFAQRGWTKERVRQFLLDNASTSVAELKRRGLYGARTEGAYAGPQAAKEVLTVQPQDETTRVFLYKNNGPLEATVFGSRSIYGEYRQDIMLVMNGGDTGSGFAWRLPHGVSDPVTIPIERPAV